MPAEFYMLSIAGETSGGQIIMGDRGRAYGICQFDYRYDLTDFIRYAYGKHPGLWAELSAYLNAADGDETLVGNTALRDAFYAAMARSYEAAITDQLEYMRARYWDAFRTRMDEAGYHLSTRHIAVQAAFFSVNVNCGVQTDLYLSEITPELTDAEIICKLYTLRNTILAEQNIGRHKKGTTARYRQYEPQMALDLLHGYVTIDSKKHTVAESPGAATSLQTALFQPWQRKVPARNGWHCRRKKLPQQRRNQCRKQRPHQKHPCRHPDPDRTPNLGMMRIWNQAKTRTAAR